MDGAGELTPAGAGAAAVVRGPAGAATLRAAGAAPPLIELRGPLAPHVALVQAARTGDPWLERTVVAVRPGVPAEVAAVLDGSLSDDHASALRFAQERFVLRHADVLLTPGGDVAGALERFYGAAALAPALDAPEPPRAPAGPPTDLPWLDEHESLRLLLAGELTRRCGVLELIGALALLGDADVTLDVRGDGPAGRDARAAAAGDRRVRFGGSPDGDGLAAAIRDAHVVVVPPLWDVLPDVAPLALALNRPVLATPVGALVELVEPDRSGWLAGGTSVGDLAAAVADVRADPDGYQRLGDGPARRAAEWGERSWAPPPPRTPRPLPDVAVGAVVTHTRSTAELLRTLGAVAAQTRPVAGTTVVDDGRRDAAAVERLRGVRLVSQARAGAAAARALGLAVAQEDLVLVLDAGDVPAPGFVARALRAFARDPELAYVTSWTPRERPLGTEDALVERADVGGPPAALWRRDRYPHSLAGTSGERAQAVHQALWRQGLRGAVVPEELIETASRPSGGRDDDALRAARRGASMRWTAA